MKKNLPVLILFAILIMACSNETIEKSSDARGIGLIKISMSSYSDIGRTVLPKNDNEAFTDIVFVGKYNDTTFDSWEWATYYDLQNDDTAIELSAGNWVFTLTAKRYGATFSQTLNSTVTENVVTSLYFSDMQISEFSADSGAISVSITLPFDISDSEIETVYASLDGDVAVLLDLTDDYESSWSSWVTSMTATFDKDNVKSGNHLLSFTVKNIDDDVLLVYPTYIVVQKGFISKANIDLTEIDEL